MYAYYDPKAIKIFYSHLGSITFESLSKQRAEDIDQVVESQRYFFTTHSVGIKTLMSFTAEKLTTSAKRFGLFTPQEIAYFYVKMVDPNFLFLEAYEACCKKEQTKELCKSEFRIYDPYLIALEKAINEALGLHNIADLWSRESFER